MPAVIGWSVLRMMIANGACGPWLPPRPGEVSRTSFPASS